MEARVSSDFQALERTKNELEDKTSPDISSLKEKLIREVHEFELAAIKLQQKLSLCEEKIKDAKKRQLEYKDFPLLSDKQEYLMKALDKVDISKSVILFNEELADKCQLSPKEKKSWAVRSDACYGSYLNPVSYMRSFSAWSGTDSYIRDTPRVGEYIAGPSSVKPEAVMLKLKKILSDSNKKKTANQDLLNALKDKEQLEKDLLVTKSCHQAHKLEIQRIQALSARITDYDRVMSLTTNVIQDPFSYLEALLKAQNEIDQIKHAEHQGFELFIKKRVDKLQADMNAVTTAIINQFDHIADSEIRYHNLLQSRQKLYALKANVPDELYIKIQKLRLQKAWDTTYEVHKFGEQKREFKHYFLGFPEDLGHKKHFAFSWLLYTIGCGFLFTPIKNTLKLFTEALPKRLDAHCENITKSFKYTEFESDVALAGHYFFKAWWLCLRPITSPIVSLKAAWNSYHNFDNKYIAWTARLVLSALSFTLSFAAILAVVFVAPKVVLGLLGEAGGVVATAAVAADSVILPSIPITYANVATALRGAMDVGWDRSSSAIVAARISLNKAATSTPSHQVISVTPPTTVDAHILASHDMQLAESTASHLRKP